MNGNTNFSAKGAAVNAAPVMSASRGILDLQGIGLSGVDVFGVQAQSMPMHSPIRVLEQDKPSAGWHPAFATTAEVGACAVEAGYAPAELRAARLRRTAHPATVIRIRQRCRTR
ncbi:hypothetical protein [Nocardia nepalensis]|uniref:hypothetical protein n=1 Tax=Nocardia nepalensis TaxID=3375448 RepID=UPI003B6820FC